MRNFAGARQALSSPPQSYLPPLLCSLFKKKKNSVGAISIFSPWLETFDKKKKNLTRTPAGMFDVGERERVGGKKNLSELKRVEVFPLWAILKVCLRVCGRARLGVTHTHTHTPERQVNVSYIWSFWKGLWKASGSIYIYFFLLSLGARQLFHLDGGKMQSLSLFLRPNSWSMALVKGDGETLGRIKDPTWTKSFHP